MRSFFLVGLRWRQVARLVGQLAITGAERGRLFAAAETGMELLKRTPLARIDVSSDSIPAVPLSLLGWSLTTFLLASAALLADLGLKWNRGTRDRAGQTAEIDALYYKIDAL